MMGQPSDPASFVTSAHHSTCGNPLNWYAVSAFQMKDDLPSNADHELYLVEAANCGTAGEIVASNCGSCCEVAVEAKELQLETTTDLVSFLEKFGHARIISAGMR